MDLEIEKSHNSNILTLNQHIAIILYWVEAIQT